jgi:cytochrome c556
MNDDFLYRLRVDPPKRFAVRLKARLDRESSPRRWMGNWGLPLLLCGTAFALAMPDLRHAIARLFAAPSSSERAEVVRDPAAPQRQAARKSPPLGVTLPREGGSTPLSHDPLVASTGSAGVFVPTPSRTARASERVADRLAAPGVTVPHIESLTAARYAGSATPEEAAIAAAETRRGLFRVMGWVMGPVIAMQEHRTPYDAALLARQAARIQTLAGLIGAVFGPDTRPFPAVQTQVLDKIWTEMPAFDAKADELAAAAHALAVSAQSGDQTAALQAAGRVGATCTACHDTYLKSPNGAQP